MKIIYNTWVKALAFVLCIIAASGAVYISFKTVGRYEDSLYDLGDEDGSYPSVEETIISNVQSKAEYLHYVLSDDEPEIYLHEEDATEVSATGAKSHSLENIEIDEKFMKGYDCYIKDADGNVLTLGGVYDKEDYENSRYGSIMNLSDGSVIMIKPSDKTIKEFVSQWEENKETWEADKYAIWRSIYAVGGLIVLGIVLLILLFWSAGKKSREAEIEFLLIDRVWPEIHAAALIAVMATWILSLAGMMDIRETQIAALFAAAITAAAAAIWMTVILSLVRMIKGRVLLKKSVLVKIFKCIGRTLHAVIDRLREIGRNIFSDISYAKVYMVLGAYTVLIAFAVLVESMLLFLAIAVTAAYFTLKYVKNFLEIRSVIADMSNGDLSRKAENCERGMLSEMAKDVNSIGEGLLASLDKSVRAERMKSELITNVSHDLKTPLTGIINYAELLSNMELEPPEANDYVKIISKKSERLKNLTEDLFDYSKMESGNESVTMEKIDLVLLVKQSMGEMDEMIKNSNLEFILKLPEHAYIKGDGKKLGRVLENLIGNALKYSMERTRVYISVRQNGKTTFEIKNIASYAMDFDTEEITERFVRGDNSRTGDGSGLGLAIARSYTEAMGGSFKIETDGDLFKAVIVI